MAHGDAREEKFEKSLCT